MKISRTYFFISNVHRMVATLEQKFQISTLLIHARVFNVCDRRERKNSYMLQPALYTTIQMNYFKKTNGK